MLKRLRIKNFAVIEELDLEFGPGLTAFTGETGAGKSILIEALGFLLGERGSVDWLRAGAAKLEVSGAFEANGDAYDLKRELGSDGKSRAWLGGRPIKIADLGALGERLVDFHGQHEHQTLLSPEIQMELLDAFGVPAKQREEVAGKYSAFKRLNEKIQALELSEEERLRRIDLYRFQVADIDEADPKPEEEAALEAELPRLKNAEKLAGLVGEAYGALYESEHSAETQLRKAEEALSAMARLDPAVEPARESVARAAEAAGEASSNLAAYRDSFGEDPGRIDDLIGRQDKLDRLKKKYGRSIEEVLAFRQRIAQELDALENHDQQAGSLRKELKKAERALRKSCDGLHAERMKAAKKLAAKVGAQLKDLGMASARLSISVEMDEDLLTVGGADRVEFLIAPNPGEPLKPLRSVASGGELSRVMLGLKTALAAQDRVGLLVFDEVDTGVGGAVGRSVGAKLAEIGGARQVFCVTHLPQVACYARTHFHVAKRVAQGRTQTQVERLDGRTRLEAVARMLGGRKITDASLRHAKELMENA